MRTLITLFLALLLVSCGTNQEDPVISQMQMRHRQTHTFVGHSKQEVMKAIVAVLQDQGFMVKNASSELGLLTAEQNTDIETFSSKFWAQLFTKNQPRWKKHSLLEMTSNITQHNDRVVVRINFLTRCFDNMGRVIDVQQIHASEPYRDFFNQVQKGLINSPNSALSSRSDVAAYHP